MHARRYSATIHARRYSALQAVSSEAAVTSRRGASTTSSSGNDNTASSPTVDHCCPSSSSRPPPPPAAPEPEAARAALEYCARLVRQHDPDSYAWAVLLPKEERARVLALRALNVETLLVPASASSSGRRGGGGGSGGGDCDAAAAMLRIRYQWWRDAVRAAMDAPLAAEAAAARKEEEDDDDAAGEEGTDDDEGSAAAASGGRRRSRPMTATADASPSRGRPPKPPPPAHPVITALWAARAAAGPRLQRYPLRRLVDAREREALSAALGEPAPARLSDLEDHAEATHAQLMYAQLAAIGGGRGGGADGDDDDESSSSAAAAADHAASHAGKAVGLAMALRGAPYAAARRRCALPLDVCASAGLSQEDLFRRAAAVEAGRGGSPAAADEWPARADAALRDASLEVASRAMGHLEEARALMAAAGGGGGGGRLRAHALLPAVAAEMYLRSLERAQFDVFHPVLRPPPPRGGGKGGGAGGEEELPPLGAGLGVSPLRYLLSLRWHAWRGTF